MALSKIIILKTLIIILVCFMSSCSSLHLKYQEPSVELVSFKVLGIDGFEQKFEIGLKLTNPNNYALPLSGISYELNIAGETLAHGVAADIPTISAFGESRFVVPISTSLLRGVKVIKALLANQGQDINYQLNAQLAIDIPFVPSLNVIEEGKIPFN